MLRIFIWLPLWHMTHNTYICMYIYTYQLLNRMKNSCIKWNQSEAVNNNVHIRILSVSVSQLLELELQYVGSELIIHTYIQVCTDVHVTITALSGSENRRRSGSGSTSTCPLRFWVSSFTVLIFVWILHCIFMQRTLLFTHTYACACASVCMFSMRCMFD